MLYLAQFRAQWWWEVLCCTLSIWEIQDLESEFSSRTLIKNLGCRRTAAFYLLIFPSFPNIPYSTPPKAVEDRASFFFSLPRNSCQLLFCSLWYNSCLRSITFSLSEHLDERIFFDSIVATYRHWFQWPNCRVLSIGERSTSSEHQLIANSRQDGIKNCIFSNKMNIVKKEVSAARGYDMRAQPRRRLKEENEQPLFLKKAFNMIESCPPDLGS